METSATRERWGEAIRRQRKVVGLTQAQLAEKVKVHQTSVSQWEHGKVAPDPDLHQAIAEALSADAATLFSYGPATSVRVIGGAA